MNESILNSLMNLYALIAYANKEASPALARSYVESYLNQYYSKKVSFKQLELFDFHLHNIIVKHSKSKDLKSSFSVQILQICEQINKELHQKQKLLVLINALQFITHWRAYAVEGFENEKTVSEILDTIALVFKFDEKEFSNIRYFIYDQLYKITNKKKILLVKEDSSFPVSGINIYIKAGIRGNLFVYHVELTNTYLLRFNGKEKLELSGKTVFPNQVYILDKGASLKGELFETIYYSEIVAQYMMAEDKLRISFEARDIEFRFPNSNNGIQKFSFTACSGQLIGVMGGSGTGKSTLLNVLNGNLDLTGGEILINGYNIKTRKNEIEGVIGYIPQDDLLIEELTVYQNLYYNTRLCFSRLSEEELHLRIQNLLVELDLWEAKDLMVGTPLKNYISGGQRKRLNIALELVRKPSVLFVDEPTSGLSSADSEKVIELLKEEALKGNFLVVNIHQPSSLIFKQFDKLIVLDKGGYPIYFGDPIDAIGYFKKITKRVDATENECHCCGSVNPAQILELVELKDVNEIGEYSNHRKIGPQQWYENFIEKRSVQNENYLLSKKLPKNNFKVPSAWKQFSIFSTRNFFSKIADKQFVIISLLITPVLAFLMAFITKYLVLGDDQTRTYIFSENENIPAFFFVSIVVALFVGLVISAEEIIKDLKILKRESFLNLSKYSYLNAKIVFMFLLSLLQSFMYVSISCWVLEIKGFLFSFWAVFFSLSFLANLTGLNISSALKSVVTIYVLIPLILVPQILLGGVFVKFDKLNPLITSEFYVPLVGDLMVSRWAFEALMVDQFKHNKYQENFYEVNKKISEASFIMNYTIPELNTIVSKIKHYPESDQIENEYHLLLSECSKIVDLYNLPVPPFFEKPGNYKLDEEDFKTIRNYFDELRMRLGKYIDQLITEKDQINKELTDKHGKDYISKLKSEYTNDRLDEFVLNNRELKRIRKTKKQLVQLYEPVYLTPDSKFGRAHFFAPLKIIGNNHIDTFWFNLIVIWFFNIVLYISLLKGWLRKLINFVEIKLKI